MNNSEQYQRARKRVKDIKGFYIHALIFVVVNLFLLVSKYLQKGEIDPAVFYGTALWGVGLLCHGASVFLHGFFLGKNWEEKKIRELMNKNKSKTLQ